MDVRTGPKHRDTGAGFTLVELLLAVTLLILLLGAIVYNFSGLQRGAQLEEGARQIEALIRFARAHAANTGTQVQICFEEDVGQGLLTSLGKLRVLWEPDPIARPGIFEPLLAAEEYVRSISDLISIDGVRLVESNNFETESPNASGVLEENSESNSVLVTFPPIGFFPDGSSDSAVIIIASRAEEDSRRIAVRLEGITGSIRRNVVTDKLKAAEPESQTRAPAEMNSRSGVAFITGPRETLYSASGSANRANGNGCG